MNIMIVQMCCQWVIARTNDMVAMTWVKCGHFLADFVLERDCVS